MTKSNFLFFISFICVFFIQNAKAQCPADCRYLYVDGAVATSGAGTSWGAAFKTVQEAIDAANTMSPADTVIIKAGTYKPDNGADRTKSFNISVKEVYIYGGYVGTELETVVGGLLPLTDPVNNVTILSGDIGVAGIDTDNSYHVVQIAGTIKGKMSGLTITKGYADGTTPEDNGRGIWTNGGTTFDLDYMRITSNFANANGGGLYVSTGSQIYMRLMNGGYTVANSFGFDNNRATNNGGAVFYEGASKLKAESIYFGNNTVQGAGGAMYIGGGSQITGVFGDFIFEKNKATAGIGGAVIIAGDIPNATILEATFKENESLAGGAIYVANITTDLTLLNMIFIRNKSNSGGAVSVFNSNNLKLQHFTLKDNVANNANAGGGIFIHNNDVNQNITISNCLLW